MKTIVVGNYLPDRQWSMIGFCDQLVEGLQERGLEIEVIRPEPRFQHSSDSRSAKQKKYAAYLDKYLYFPMVLKRKAATADLVHIVDQANAVYLPSLTKPTLLTVHDLLAIKAARGMMSYWQVGKTGQLLQNWIARCLPQASAYSCVSNKTAADLKEMFSVPSDSVSTTYNCFYDDFRSAPKEQGGFDAPFVHHVGGNQPYKNRVGALRFAEKWLIRPGYHSWKLRLVGAPPDEALQDAINRSPLGPRIAVETDVSRDRLAQLYHHSQALIFPSLDEGFGLPILEAQSAGCPVITTAKEPMSEVAGASVIYLDPEESALEQACALPGTRECWTKKGFENLARFDRSQMLDDYAALYRKLGGQS